MSSLTLEETRQLLLPMLDTLLEPEATQKNVEAIADEIIEIIKRDREQYNGQA